MNGPDNPFLQLPERGPPQHPLLCAKIRELLVLVQTGLDGCQDEEGKRPKRINVLMRMRNILPHIEYDIESGDVDRAYALMQLDFDTKTVKSAFFKQNKLLKLAQPIVQDLIIGLFELNNLRQ